MPGPIPQPHRPRELWLFTLWATGGMFLILFCFVTSEKIAGLGTNRWFRIVPHDPMNLTEYEARCIATYREHDRLNSHLLVLTPVAGL